MKKLLILLLLPFAVRAQFTPASLQRNALTDSIKAVQGTTNVAILSRAQSDARFAPKIGGAYVPGSRTISTTSPLLGGGDLSANRTFSIQVANGSQDGYLSAANWNTFNGKQAALSGTGFVKISGTTISYDNSTYLTTATAASTYAPIAGTMYIGTTAHALNRASASENLSGITGLTPGADFTISQNSVSPFTSINSGAVANTLYMNAGKTSFNTNLSINGARTTVVDAVGNPQLSLANSSSNYLSMYVDNAGKTFFQPNGNTRATLDATGNLNLSGVLNFASTTPTNQGDIGYSSVYGMYAFGKTGSTDDYALFAPVGGYVFHVPTGTNNMAIPSLAGTGTRMVVADNVGVLSTQAIPSGGGGGTVASVSVNSSNGFAGTSSGGANPALTLSTTVTGITKGNGTALSAAVDGTDYLSPSTAVNTSAPIASLTQNNTTNGYGLAISSEGTASTRYALVVKNLSGSVEYFKISTETGSVGAITTSGTMAVGGALSASNLSGTNTGDQTSVSGNAGTATALQNARTIAGVSFDGTANISLNNNAITNGAGYITASSSDALSNKTGNISQWTNNSGYITSAALSGYAPLASPTFTGTVIVPWESFSSSWNGKLEPPTKDAIWDALSNGTYVATLTNTTNIDASTLIKASYQRIGTETIVYAEVEVEATAGGVECELRMTLPNGNIVSNATDLRGHGTAYDAVQQLRVTGVAGGGAKITWSPNATAPEKIYFSFMCESVTP